MQIFGLLRNHQICGQLAVKRVRLQGILLAALLRVHLCGIVPKLGASLTSLTTMSTSCSFTLGGVPPSDAVSLNLHTRFLPTAAAQ